jgi:hypothetical protein
MFQGNLLPPSSVQNSKSQRKGWYRYRDRREGTSVATEPVGNVNPKMTIFQWEITWKNQGRGDYKGKKIWSGKKRRMFLKDQKKKQRCYHNGKDRILHGSKKKLYLQSHMSSCWCLDKGAISPFILCINQKPITFITLICSCTYRQKLFSPYF